MRNLNLDKLKQLYEAAVKDYTEPMPENPQMRRVTLTSQMMTGAAKLEFEDAITEAFPAIVEQLEATLYTGTQLAKVTTAVCELHDDQIAAANKVAWEMFTMIDDLPKDQKQELLKLGNKLLDILGHE